MRNHGRTGESGYEAVREKSVEDLASYLKETGVPDIYCECFEGKVSLCSVVMFIYQTR